MPCNEVLGDWIRGILADDSTEEVSIDPLLRIDTDSSGNLRGTFQMTGETSFPVVCHDTGRRIRIEFRRTHPLPAGAPTGTTPTITEYNGRVVPFGQRAVVGIIKGRFRRATPRQSDGRLVVTSGDWETEKPT